MVRNWRLKRADFKHFLAIRYSNQIWERILSHFDISNPWTYEDYWNWMESFIFQSEDFFYKVTFEWLDISNDDELSEVDIFQTMINMK